jgi:hypothetical protein
MADEFAKGFGILVTAGLGWFTLAGWYNTPDFETQLTAANPESVGVYGQLALLLKDAFFWFAILGALTFWVVIPSIERAREAMAE